MSSPDPRPNLLSKLADALLEAVKELHPILRFVIAVVILLVMVVILQAAVPKELLPLFYILPILGLVAYLAVEVLLFIERKRKPAADQPAPPPSATAAPAPSPLATSQPGALERDPTAAQLSYLRRLQTVCNTLMLQYIDPRSFESDQVRRRVMELADVYTALDTTAQVEEEKGAEKRERAERLARPERATRPLTALEAAALERQMVLLGDAGSGKSTFVKHLALCMAGELLQPGGDWLARLGAGWQHGLLFPLLVTLRDFARSPHCDGSAQGLWAYMAREVGDFAPRLQQQLERDGGVLLLFDGLDEVAEQRQRARVRDAVAAFAQTYNQPRNRYLVTCRVYAYLQRDDAGRYLFQLPEPFAVYTLAEFSEGRINDFIAAWYQEVYQLGWKTETEARELAGRLQEAVRRSGLQVLASRPLLLTVMALLHTTRGRLPDDRVKLYQETVELLLARWQEARLGEESGLSCMVNLDRLETALEKTTYEAHLAQPGEPVAAADAEGLADLSEQDLRRAFAQECLDGDWNRAGDLIAYVRERAGLLVERVPGVYTFPHRTFQEYMAAAHLCTRPAFPQEAARLLHENPAQWREVVLMAVGIMARIKKLPYIALYVVDALCPADAPSTMEQRRAVPEEGWRAAWQAGEAVLEIGLEQAAEAGAQRVARVRDWLAALVETGALSPRERAAAGSILDELGWLPEDLDAWVLCPGCAEDGGDLLVGKYPVTNAQYARFVEAGGYGERRWWSEEGWQWRRAGKRRLSSAGTDEPEYWNYPRLGRERRGYPVVGVSWYEAEAYCKWLTGQFEVAGCR